MQIKNASLLDFSFPGLPTDIWQADGTLLPYHKDFVLKLLNSFYTNNNFISPEQWIKDVTVIGSLTTNKFLRVSDFDCHVLVDINKFIETNMPKASKEEALEYLDQARKTWDRARIMMPFGEHCLELFVESPEENPSNVEHVGRYSILTDKWLKEPIFFAQDEDFEASRMEAIEGAKELANELDDSFGEIGRQIQRIDELKEVLQAWPEEKRQLYYEKIQKKLDIIEEEIEKSIQIKQELVDERHENQDAFSDNEIQFKFLARFHYFTMLQYLKKLLEQTGGEVSTTELPLIEKIISEGSINKKAFSRGAWIDPNGKIYPIKSSGMDYVTHGDWMVSNKGLLKKQYGINDPDINRNNLDTDYSSVTAILVANGWARIGDVAHGAGFGVEVSDLRHIQNSVFDFLMSESGLDTDDGISFEDLDGHYVELEARLLPDGQKAINQELTHVLYAKRIQTASLDFDSWFNGSKVVDSNGKPLLCHHETNVDFKKVNPKKTTQGIFWFTTDRGSIDRGETGAAGHGMVKDFYVSMKNPAGWKEYENLLLVQLKSQGYDGALLSQGDGTYNGFVFDNSQIWWVTPKKSSLDKQAILDQKYWIAPDGKSYPAGDVHIDFILDHPEILNKYGFDTSAMVAAQKEYGNQAWEDLSMDLMQQMHDQGWIDVTTDTQRGQFGQSFGIRVPDIRHIPSTVDQFLSEHSPTEDQGLYIEDNHGKYVRVNGEDAISKGIQRAVNKALQQKRLQPVSSLNKQAGGVIDINGVRVFKNPSFEQVENIWENSKRQYLKAVVDPRTKEYFIFDAYDGHHTQIMEALGIPSDQKTYDNFTWDLQEFEDIDNFFSTGGDRRKLEYPKVIEYTSSLKQAFLKEAFEEPKEAETDICIDLDKTIAQEATFPAIGEPIEGAKESLAKLQEMGYNVVIYSCRADSEDGLELVREWLDKHEIPYDSIFEGKKPFSKYFIDDKAIHFDSWKNVLKQVEKSDKTASLHIVAYDRAQAAYWIDPNGKVYPVKTTHEDWFFEQEDLLRTQYQYGQDELGQDWWDIKTGNLLNQLLEDGWLRVGDLFAAGRKSIGTGIEIANLSSIPPTLIDFVANWGKDKYFQIEDLQRRVVELSVEELVADGQEAINRALQQEKMLSRRSSFDLPVIDPKTLGRKEPYALFIGTQWNAKHTVGLDLYNIYPMTNADNGVPTVGLQTLTDKNIPIIGKEPRAGDKQPAQDISGLYKQALKKEAAYSHAYWIDPKGKVFQVRGEGVTSEDMNRGDLNTHSDWVRANIDMLVKEYGFKAKPAKSTELFSMPITSNDLIAQDWIRIGDSSGGSEWGVTLKDLNYIPQSVDNLLAQFVPEGARITIEEDTSWQNSVQIEWPVNSVQLAVNQARRQQPVVASLDKKAGNVGTYWIDPNGKTYKVPGTHTAWVGRNVEKLNKKFGYDLPLGLNEQGGHQYTDLLLDKGWVRILGTPGNAQFVIDVKDLSHIPPSVDNFIAENFKTWWEPPIPIWIGTGNNMLTIYDPFPNIQDAVNKALSQKRMGSKAFSKKEITAQTKKVKQGEYGTIMALVPHNIAQEIVEWGVRNIKDSDVFSDEENPRLGRELEPHVTVKYGLLEDNPKTVRQFFNDAKPFKATLGKVRHFEPEGMEFDVVTVEIISKDLEEMNKKVTDHFKCAEGLVSDEYHPHITVSYVKRGKGKDYIGSKDFEGKEIDLDTLIISPRKGNRTYFSIGSDKESSFILERMNKFAAGPLGNSAWIAPDGKVFPLDENGDYESHEDWVLDNGDIRTEYGIDDPRIYDMEREELISFMCSHGWSRFGDMGFANTGLEVPDVMNISSAVFDYVASVSGGLKEITVASADSPDWGWVTLPMEEFLQGQKGVNKAIQRMRLQGSIKAAYRGDVSGWLSPDSKLHPVWNTHSGWVVDNAHVLKEYGLDAKEIFDSSEGSIEALLMRGWVRVNGHLPTELDLEVADINNIPQVAEQFVWKYKPEVVIVEDLNGNDVSFDREEYSKGMMKKAEFLPSMAENAPTNLWQFNEGGSDVEICEQPDPVSDEETFYAPCTVQKPRDPDIYRQFLSMFSKPISKKDEMTVDSAYDPEFEEIERKELGEDETLNDFSKGMYDPKKHDFPHNTTWDVGPEKAPNQHEPYSPLPVTLDMVQNPANNDQNSPGGFPGRFCQPPKSEWFSDEGEIVPALKNMFKNREAAINSLTRDIISSLIDTGGWISPSGKYIETDDHYGYVDQHMDDFGLSQLKTMPRSFERISAIIRSTEYIFSQGWIRVRIWGDTIMVQGNTFQNIKAHAEDFIYNNLNKTKKIRIELNDEQAYVCTTEEFKQDGWNAFLKKPVMAKQAEIIEVGLPYVGAPLRVIVNPTYNEAMGAFKRTEHGLRYLVDDEANTFIWNSWNATHTEVAGKLVESGYKVSNTDVAGFLEDESSVEEMFSLLAKKAGILPPQQPITENTNAGTAIMMDDGSIYFSDEPYMVHVKLIKRLGLPVEHIVSGGLIKDGVYYDQGVQSTDTMRYVEQQMAQKRCDEKVEQLKRVREKQAQHKQAEVIEIGLPYVGAPLRVIVNPTYNEALGALKRTEHGLRYLEDDDGNTFIWNSWNATHEEVAGKLRESGYRVSNTDSAGFLDSKSCVDYMFGPSAKTAGSYSSTYTDEQGEQFFNEQHHDNVDEEPYVDHSERDYDGGYWDAATNTGQNTPWAKDITPSVCLLDQLQNPADRNYPPGMPDYSIVFYEALPASDGIEKSNPD